MTRILVVEDEHSIADMVKMCLSKNGYVYEVAYDGYELIEYIKEFDIPVIFVTVKTSVPDRVKGLNLGAEDYISKPFDLEELLARIATVLRRCRKTENVLEIGRIKIDTLQRIVLLDGVPVALPAKEYDLFLFFSQEQKYSTIPMSNKILMMP